MVLYQEINGRVGLTTDQFHANPSGSAAFASAGKLCTYATGCATAKREAANSYSSFEMNPIWAPGCKGMTSSPARVRSRCFYITAIFRF